MLLRLKITVAAFAIALAIGHGASMSLAEMPTWKPVPPGDEIEWANVALRAFSGHECGKVIEAHRLPDGTIQAKCESGELFRIALRDGEPIAVMCADAEKYGMKAC
jgi:hypothetical protein